VKSILVGKPNSVIDCSFAEEDVAKLYLGVRYSLEGTGNMTKISEVDGATLEELQLKSSILSVSHTCRILQFFDQYQDFV
jgi:hypothetical protein